MRFKIPLLRSAALALATTLATILCGPAALAQEWPARPILTVYPFAPGSNGDALARILATELGAKWGQSIVVENRIGGSGILGYNALQSAKPDGYTYSWLHNGLTVIRRAADPKFTAEVGKDYEAVVELYENFTRFAAHPSSPFKTMREFIAYAKANPRKLNIAMGGRGSADQISGEMLKEQLGIDYVIVFYPSSARAIPAGISGETQAIMTATSLKAQVDARQLIPLAAFTPQPVPVLAAWPSLSEAGVNDWKGISTTMGLFAPAGTSRDIIMKYNLAVNAMLKDPNFTKRMIDVVPVGGTPEQAANRIRSSITNVGPTVRRLKITFD